MKNVLVEQQPMADHHAIKHGDQIVLLLNSSMTRYNEVTGEDSVYEYVEAFDTLPWDDPRLYGVKILLEQSVLEFAKHCSESGTVPDANSIVPRYFGLLRTRFVESYGANSDAFPYEIDIEQYLRRCLDVLSNPIPF